jgi:hypothetical protein
MSNPDAKPPADEKKRRGQRNAAIALMLFAFIVIIYGVTILRLSGNVGQG